MYSLRSYQLNPDGTEVLFNDMPLNATNDTEAQAESRNWFMGDGWRDEVYRVDQADRVGAWAMVDGDATWIK